MKTKNLCGILMLFLFTLPFLVGCEKYLKGEEKILGTATINGQNYKESIVWDWNFQGYPSCLEFYENYKLFYFITRLSPEKGDNPSYNINFSMFQQMILNIRQTTLI